MARLKMVIVFVVLLAASAAAQREAANAARSTNANADASKALLAENLSALESDLQRMRSLVMQMQSNLALVTTTTTPLKHQFELEIEMWNVLIASTQRRLDTIRSLTANAGASPSAILGQAEVEGSDSRYHRLLDNEVVRVSSIDLPARSEAPVYQNVHDVLWIAISKGTLTFRDRERQEKSITFLPGDTRLFRRDQVLSVRNSSTVPVRSVVVELKKVGLVSSCGCDSQTEKAVCGCAGAAHAPELWAVALGEVTAAGTTLTPGESQSASTRGDLLIVDITSLELRDETGTTSIRLAPAQVAWIPAGTHRLRNAGTTVSKFVSLEF